MTACCLHPMYGRASLDLVCGGLMPVRRAVEVRLMALVALGRDDRVDARLAQAAKRGRAD